ncbi:MAG: hypothetical protein QME81_19435, partial [bacterium]|nr:hypothetical protein [bacterium]
QIEYQIEDTVRSDKNETNKKREELQDDKYGCSLWVLLWIGGTTLLVELDARMLVIIYIWVILPGGWFIAKGILKALGYLLYTEKDFSQFIAEKQREKSEIEKCRNKLSSILFKFKGNSGHPLKLSW